jgi:mono/diheme cytochrome c family protein
VSSPQTRKPAGRPTRLLMAFVAGMLATPFVGLALALSGFISVDAASTPPGWESKIGQSGLEASLLRRSQGLVVPSPIGEAELIAGMNTYRNDCAGCHGDYGQHRSGGGLYPPVPQFNQHPPALTAGEMFFRCQIWCSLHRYGRVE